MTSLRAVLAIGVLALSLALAACGSGGGGSSSGAKTLSFQLTDAGCDPHDAKAPAGPVTFEAENVGSSSVTEIEVLDGETILAEKENLSEGLDGSFSLPLKPGEYTLRCNGGEEEDGTLTVSGKLEAQSRPRVEAAVERYRRYLEKNTDELVRRTKPFVAALLAGEVAAAMDLYAPARVPYERIEPVAESFGDLDPRIDARENDITAGEFGGFHRLEKALWEEGTTAGTAPVARQLLSDVEELQERAKAVELQAVQVANGANQLLGEVSASKITGEEERYSHLDLVDLAANVEGANAAFDATEPLLGSEQDAGLAKQIEASFKDVETALRPYRRGDRFVTFAELTRADTRELAHSIDALAELLSETPAQIAGAATDEDD